MKATENKVKNCINITFLKKAILRYTAIVPCRFSFVLNVK